MDTKKIMTILNALFADYDEFVDNDQMDDADSTWKYAMEQLTDFIEEEKKKAIKELIDEAFQYRPKEMALFLSDKFKK